MKRFTTRSLSQILLAIGALAFSVVVLGLLLYRERALLLTFQWQLDPLFLSGAFGLFFAGLVIATLTWATLMRRLGSTLPYTTHIDHYCLSQLAKRLPGTLWYLAGRSYLYKQDGESLRLVTFASSIELFITILSGSLTSLLFAGYSLSKQTPFPWGWVLVSVLGLLFLHPKPLHYLLRRFNIVETPRLHYAQLLLWVGLYSLIWILGGAVLYMVSRTVTPISLTELPYFIGSWSLVGTLSILVFFLPSNLGFTEVGLSLLLSPIIPSSLAVIVAVANRIFLLCCELVGIPALIMLIRLFKRRRLP
jgi:glycosyltransferase 2 family protein